MRKGFWGTIGRGLVPVARGASGGYAQGWNQREGLDWSLEAGRRIDNSIVYAAVLFACKFIPSARPKVRRLDREGGYEVVEGHPIELLLNSPVPWYDGPTLSSLQTTGEIIVGNSYAFKHRSPGGKLVGLEFLPSAVCQPYTNPGGGDFVTGYRISVQGGQFTAAPADVLHMRWHTRNPWYPALGLGPLEAALPHIAIDNRAARIEGSCLRNNGYTPALISPTASAANGQQIVFGDLERAQIKEAFQGVTGDNAGEPLVSPIPVDVQKLVMSLDELGTDMLHNLSEERLCAVMGIPPTVLHLGTGLENENNRASKGAALVQARDHFVSPYLELRARQLTADLIPELGSPGEEVWFDTSGMAIYSEDEDAQVERNVRRLAYTTPNEVRALEGLPPIEGGDVLRAPALRERNNDR